MRGLQRAVCMQKSETWSGFDDPAGRAWCNAEWVPCVASIRALLQAAAEFVVANLDLVIESAALAVSSRWPAGFIPLVSGPVVAQDPEGLMQWFLPAFRATGCAAHDLEVAAAGCAGRPAVTCPPVDDDCAWLPGMTEAAVLREAGKRRSPWLLHGPYTNI